MTKFEMRRSLPAFGRRVKRCEIAPEVSMLRRRSASSVLDSHGKFLADPAVGCGGFVRAIGYCSHLIDKPLYSDFAAIVSLAEMFSAASSSNSPGMFTEARFCRQFAPQTPSCLPGRTMYFPGALGGAADPNTHRATSCRTVYCCTSTSTLTRSSRPPLALA